MLFKKRNTEKTVREVVLRNLGVKSITEVNDWFQKSYKGEYKIYDSQKFVDYITPYKQKKVRLVGDYDADGICSLYILIKGLKMAGFQYISYRIPTREEGYGINRKIIDECIRDGIELIITCDNGIAAIDEIQLAADNGIKTIVTDHHEAFMENGKVTLPNADLIINPKAIPDSSDYEGYCGAGVVYKLMCELHKENKMIQHQLQAVAAIATIADVMELREENYVIVKNGLKKLKNPKLITNGLYALLCALDLSKTELTSKSVAFKLAPCLNAPERMYNGGALDALNLLLYDGDFQKAITFAEKCIQINEERKKYVNIIYPQMVEEIDKTHEEKQPIVFYNPLLEIKEGIIGILASRISEEYQVPCYILTKSKSVLKGSARGYGNYDVKAVLDKAAEILEKHGGHKEAGGFSLKEENYESFRKIIQSEGFVAEKKEHETTYYDIEVSSDNIVDVMHEISLYEPYGKGNPYINVLVKNLAGIPNKGNYCTFLGENKNVVKIASKNFDAVSYESEKFIEWEKKPFILNVVGTLETVQYWGNKRISLKMDGFEFVQKKTQTSLAEKLRAI